MKDFPEDGDKPVTELARNTQNLLVLESVMPFMVEAGCVTFKLGRQSDIGRLLSVLTAAGYIAFIFITLALPDDGNSWLATWQGLLFGALCVLFIGSSMTNLLEYTPHFLLMVCITVVGATVIAYYEQWNSLLLGALALIVLGHAGGYWIEEVVGDNLFIRLFPQRYEMFYRKRVVKFGYLLQEQIHFHCQDTGEGMVYRASFGFQAAVPTVVDGIVFDKVDIMTSAVDGGHEEIISDLGKIFAFLEIPCDQDRWRPEGDLYFVD